MPARIQARYLSARQTVVYLGMVDDTDPDRERAIKRAVQALYQRVHRKQIAFVRLGARGIRFDRRVLDAMMEAATGQRQAHVTSASKEAPSRAGYGHWSRHLRRRGVSERRAA
jgi:hypothetical protein